MPRITIADLLKDTKKFSNDLVIKLDNDAELSLGDLRTYNESTGGELARQMKELEAERAKVSKAGETVAGMFVELEKQKAALGNQPNPAARSNDFDWDKYERDDVFGPLVKTLRTENASLASKLDKTTENVDKLVKSIAQMGTTYMGDKATRDFNALPADDPVRPKDLTLDALYKYATERRIYDRNNLPDLTAAYNNLTADARREHDIKAAEERGRQKRDQELAENAMLPRPVSGLPAVPEGFTPPKNMGDAFSRAGSDKDLWKTIQEMSVVQ